MLVFSFRSALPALLVCLLLCLPGLAFSGDAGAAPATAETTFKVFSIPEPEIFAIIAWSAIVILFRGRIRRNR